MRRAIVNNRDVIIKTIIMTLVFLGLLFLPPRLLAQEPPPGRPMLTEVWVTTQDNSNLRAGPGELWEVLAVLPPGTTLRATGRTVDGGWLQVAYEEPLAEGVTEQATIDSVTYGWIADWLLVWTGDILTLPVDGVQTVRIARRSNPRITIEPGTRYYRDGVDPSTRVYNVITEPTEVELTGRIGAPSGGYYWLQFRMNGQYYWTATWEVGDIRGHWLLPDGSYIYSYGRLLIQLRQEINDNGITLNAIGRRWLDLDAGYAVTCNDIPADAGLGEHSFSAWDLSREPVYAPAADALDLGIEQTNVAIAMFREVCARTGDDRFVRPAEVQEALEAVSAAGRSFNLARTLLDPLGRRDPLLGNRRLD